MQKILFLSLMILTAPLFAQTLILSKFASSGYIQPEHSFSKSCNVFREGVAKITTRFGSNPPTSRILKIRPERIFLIQTLNRLAQSGRLQDEGTRCDAGSMILDGYVNGVKVLLDENKDCESHIVNKSRATKYLQSSANQICGF